MFVGHAAIFSRITCSFSAVDFARAFAAFGCGVPAVFSNSETSCVASEGP